MSLWLAPVTVPPLPVQQGSSQTQEQTVGRLGELWIAAESHLNAESHRNAVSHQNAGREVFLRRSSEFAMNLKSFLHGPQQ